MLPTKWYIPPTAKLCRILLVFWYLNLVRGDLSNPTPDLNKSQGANLVAPGQRNDFGIVQLTRSQVYARKMVVWLTLTRV